VDAREVGLGSVRRAVAGDAAELVRLRGLMFEAMGIEAAGDVWQRSAERHLQKALIDEGVVAVVVDAPEGGLAAGGVIEFQDRIPSPANPSGRAAYVSNMCTDRRWRRRGLARAVLAELLAEAARRGVDRVELHATDEGIDLYRSVGFVVRTGGPEMRLAGKSAVRRPGDRPGRAGASVPGRSSSR
jgi:ribosomal protein S18 acetylase RimI-like enzyme